MRTILAGGAIMLALCAGAFGLDPVLEDASAEIPRIRLELKDGSSILGRPIIGELRVTARYGWFLDVPYRWISSFSFNPDATNSVLHLLDGDQLSVQIRDPSIHLDSLLGVLEIKVESIDSMVVVPAQADLPLALQKGLLAFFPFMSDEGKCITDHSGMKRDGEVVNAKWTADGKVGGAMRFGPDVSYVVASDKGLPVGDSPRSIAFWMKLASIESLFQTVSYGPMNFNQACNLVFDHRLGRNSIGFSQYGIINVASRKLSPDRWYHIVYTYGGGNDHVFYIDGVRDDLAVREIRGRINTVLAGTLFLGARGHDGGHGVDGWLDEVMIYDRELSASEARQIYELDRETLPVASGAQGSISEVGEGGDITSNLSAYYRFENNVLDETGAHDGVAHGCTYSDGVVGKAISFNGVSDYVDAGVAREILDSPQLSFAYWIKWGGHHYCGASVYDGGNHENGDIQTWIPSSSNYQLARANFGTGPSLGTCTDFDAVLSANEWEHVCIALDSTQTKSTEKIRFYLNGQRKPLLSVRYDNSAIGVNLGNTSKLLRFGTIIGAPTVYMPGFLDEMRIYRRALSSEDVQKLYARSNTASL